MLSLNSIETPPYGHLMMKEAKDTYKIAYMIHFFLGAGNLLPWNALITAIDYFGYLYPDGHVEKVFSVTYMASSLLVLLLLLNRRNCLSLRVRMNLGFSMFVVSLMLHCFWQNKPYSAVVGSVFVCGLADGLIGGTLIGTAGMLPKQYMQAIFAGTASSGVVISILRIITKVSVPESPQGLKRSTFFYFIVSSSILILCIICCNLLYRLPVMRHHYKNFNPSSTDHCLWKTFTRIKFPGFGVFIIYTVTLSIFPGFLAENIKSTLLKDWFPIILIGVYNVCDFAGKSFTSIYVVKGIREATWGCIARLLFYPLFIGCFRGPEWLKSEIPVIILTTMLGFSNGYLTSVVMILTPKEVGEAEAEVAAIVMALLLGMGLLAGSLIAWFWIL